MDRRRVLSGAIALIAASTVGADGQAVGKRAAIVIGVDKCADSSLPVLSGASSGATEVAEWLRAEGYETVKLFADQGGATPVRFSSIFDSAAELIRQGNIQQLVLYFAGHGFSSPDDEVWLLSGSPNNASEAIAIRGTIRTAQATSIPRITLISDACRIPPNAPYLQEVRGSPIFESKPAGQQIVKVDQFYATRLGKAAAEAPLADGLEKAVASSVKYHGVFTRSLLRAFKDPSAEMLFKLGERVVVTNASLEPFLVHEVPRLAQSIDFNLQQFPQCDVLTHDNTYIAQVAPDAPVLRGETRETLSLPAPSQNDINSVAFRKAGLDIKVPTSTSAMDADMVDILVRESGFDITRSTVLSSQSKRIDWPLGPFRCGFAVIGKKVVEVETHPDNKAILSPLSEITNVIDVLIGAGTRACSVAIRFDDGTGTVVAALQNYFGRITVSRETIDSVVYDPDTSPGGGDDRVNELRATAAAAFRNGALRFQGTLEERQQQSERFGDTVRMAKSVDPSLGIYAAYAFDEAILPEKVNSVRSFMSADLGVDIFDIAMLNGKTISGQASKDIVPFCPALGIGWNYLSSSHVTLNKIVRDAQKYVRPSPWTAFTKEGMDLLMPALRNGTLF